MRTFKHVIFTLGLISALVVGAYFYIKKDLADTEELTKVAEAINERADQADSKSTELDMEETQVQIYLHHMTHQHVEADKKWGAVETNPQNIENLLTIAEANEDLYEHGDYYINVLRQWQEGDFSNAVAAHNFIWDIQGGTVGKATGLLSEAAKQQYEAENFSD